VFVDQFDEVDWWYVYGTLRRVTRLFQIWACKQVTGIAGTFHCQAKYNDSVDPMCRSCGVCAETAEHILFCPEIGRVDTLMKAIHNAGEWLEKVGTDSDLIYCLIRFAQGRGARSMDESYNPLPAPFSKLALSQDKIGWRRFMEGMISKECVKIQQLHLTVSGSRLSIDNWSQGLITELLDVTYGQWIY